MSVVQVSKSHSQWGQVGRADTFPGRWECGQLGKHTMNSREDSGHLPKLRLSPYLSIPLALQPPDPGLGNISPPLSWTMGYVVSASSLVSWVMIWVGTGCREPGLG